MRALQSLVPDPFVLALALALLVFGLGWASGDLGLFALIDAWAAGARGFWSLLAFGMQMCLILVTGMVLARTKPVAAVIGALARLPRSPAQATALVAVVALGTALINWGLGLVVGALLARDVGAAMARLGRPAHAPALAAAGYTGLAVWHGGLSGSAPLKVTREADLIEVLGPDLATRMGTLSLDQTIGSTRNLVVTAAAVVAMVAVLAWMTPAKPDAQDAPTPMPDDPEPASSPGLAGVLERGPWLSAPVAALGLVWVARWAWSGGPGGESGVWTMNPNAMNFALLFIGLALAGSPAGYLRHLGSAARATGGIIVQFPFYAGIMGIMAASGLAAKMAAALPDDPALLPLATFLSAGAVNLFVPSGGGQWAVQGPIAISAALDAGVPPADAVLALAWGDQWTNLIQPFWALPLLGLTGVRAGALLSYTAVAAVVVGVVFAAGTLL